MNPQVAIIHDRVDGRKGNADQKDVLVQTEAVAGALRGLGYEPYDLTLSLDLRAFFDALMMQPPAFVFNLVESVGGQGRLIHLPAGILDALKIPYTGSGADALCTTSNKLIAKRILRGTAVPTPGFFSRKELKTFGGPVQGTFIIKSVWEHASIGIEEDSVVTVKDGSALLEEMENRRMDLGGDCLAETFIEGREFNLSLLAAPQGPEVLPPAEICFDTFPPGKRRLVGYRAKWDENSFEYHHTPRRFRFPSRDTALLEDLKKLALECWHLFDLRGYARIDFRVDEENHPWVLEINTNPCLSPDAGFAAAAAEGGLSFSRVIRRVLKDMGSRFAYRATEP